MVGKRVQQVLDEIAQLSPEEREELARALPSMLGSESARRHARVEALERANRFREQLREKLAAEGHPLSSVSDDIELIRTERDAELMDPLLRGLVKRVERG